MNKKIAVNTSSFGAHDKTPLELLEKKGFEVIMNPTGRTMTKDEVLKNCAGCEGIIAGTEKYDKELLSKLKSLKVISRCGTGMDSINLNAAKELGILVINTPDAPTAAVAELVLGLIIDVLRNISRSDRAVRKDSWVKIMGHLLSEKTVGIIGFGRIGRAIALLLSAFKCKILAYDIDTSMTSNLCSFTDIEDLLKRSNIITLHVSSSKTVLIDADAISKMKKGSYLINASRGDVVDEDALYNAVKKGHIAGAALDVFEKEPYNGKLTGLENVVLTPHIGSYAIESRINMELQSVENLIKALDGDK